MLLFFFFQAEDGIRDRSPSRGLGDVYKRQGPGVQLLEKLVFGRYCVDKNGDHLDLQDAALDLSLIHI